MISDVRDQIYSGEIKKPILRAIQLYRDGYNNHPEFQYILNSFPLFFQMTDLDELGRLGYDAIQTFERYLPFFCDLLKHAQYSEVPNVHVRSKSGYTSAVSAYNLDYYWGDVVIDGQVFRRLIDQIVMDYYHLSIHFDRDKSNPYILSIYPYKDHYKYKVRSDRYEFPPETSHKILEAMGVNAGIPDLLTKHMRKGWNHV